MRITFLIRTLDRGGAERQLCLLAQGLHRRGHRVRVLTFYPGGDLRPGLEAAGVEVRSLDKRGRWDMAAFMGRLLSELLAEPPQVLHGYMGTANVLAALLRPWLPATRIVWGVRSSYRDFRKYDWLTRANFELECGLSRQADGVISNSSAGRDFCLAHGYPAARLEVIPNGIEAERLGPDPEAGRRFRRTWGIPEGAHLAGMVGRLDPVKGHTHFFRALARLAGQAPELRAVVVGHAPERALAEARAELASLGIADRVTWVPPQDDMVAVYSALDLLVSASLGEGFSNVIGEAMACAVPCAVTDVGDSAWLVGDAGRVVPAKDPEALAAAIAGLLSEDRAALGARARARIVENFSEAALVARTEALLKDWVG